jgi:hypothetical protein
MWQFHPRRVGPRRWSTRRQMRRHNRRVLLARLICRFSQFFILAHGTYGMFAIRLAHEKVSECTVLENELQ